MIEPTASFSENLQKMPAVDGLARIEIVDAAGLVVATIENQPGKQGSLVVYQYLAENFENLNAQAAEHGVAIFAEYTADARNRPGAHPNIDRLFDIIQSGAALNIRLIKE